LHGNADLVFFVEVVLWLTIRTVSLAHNPNGLTQYQPLMTQPIHQFGLKADSLKRKSKGASYFLLGGVKFNIQLYSF